MTEVHFLTTVVASLVLIALLLVVWSGEVHGETGLSAKEEQVLDVILTALAVFALTDLWGLI